MSLSSGTRVGAYEIVEWLGAGGMGEVYRAKDTRLGRAVALKFLSESVAGDPDRLARFQREAHVLAALNHARIAGIYGLEHEAGGQLPFLVMELVEGEDLSSRIARGPIPIDEAVPIATQIAEALEAAHNAGVIHRDLKPANIKVRPDGTVKVLDFGLAKIAHGADSSSKSDLSHLPTITSPAQLTGQGVVLGTAAYMSPEQAKGRAVDKRADVWAFGAVLYEMLTGRRCFDGEDVGETFAAILRATPDWSALPVATPPAIRRLMRRCLERDLPMRLSDMAMARIELHEAKTGSPEDALAPAAVVVSRSTASRLLPYVATVLLATGTGMSVWWLARPAGALRPQVRLALVLPEDQRIALSNRGVVAISPDGSRVAYAANQRLYLRALDQAAATPLPGTEAPLVRNAPRSPFFSPDGQWVAFYQEGQLKKVPVNGGGPIAIGSVPDYIGASWGSDDQILLGGGAAGGGIFQVAAGGGAAERLITSAEGDRMTQPYALPGGDWILYTINPVGTSLGKLVVQSRATGEKRELLDGVEDVRYVQSGHLVFMRANTLYAQAFDAAARTTRGQPAQILEGVASATGVSLAAADVSSSGTLVFIGTNRERSLTSSLVHVSRDGTRAVLATVSGLAWFPRYSPDGTRVAFGLSEVTDLNEPSDLWVIDVVRGARTRVTFAENTRFYPIWSRDGTRLTFATGTGLTNRLQSALADGSGGLESLTEVETRRFPTSWSPDGRTLAFHAGRAQAPDFEDLLMLHADGDKWTAKPFVATPFNERGAIFSPNGRWVAYVSNKSGMDDIYARPFPGPGAEITISVGGGAEPVWGPSGSELFYRRDGKLMAVRLEERGGSLVVSSPSPVIDDPYRPDTSGAHAVANYDIAPDGKRFVMVEVPQETAAIHITRLEVILNWLDELKRRVPSR